jgi:hypothetical protein
MIKDIKFKYTKAEMFAVLELYERTVLTDKSDDIMDRLLLSLLLVVYKRIRKMTIDVKDKYTLKYSAPEAIAYVLYFKDVTPTSPYEDRLIKLTISDTDRKLL